MKKFVFGFLPMLFVLLGAAMPVRALTLQWDKPGAIVVQTKLNDASTNIEIDPTVTEIVLEKGPTYYIRPAAGYMLSTCETVSGGTSKFNISNNNGQFVSVSQWYDGYTLKFTTVKSEPAGSVSINVINGADKISGQLTNTTDKKMSTNTLVTFKDGKQTLNLTNFDNNLNISKANGATLQSIFSVTLNGEAKSSSSAYYPQYNIPIKDGDKIEIQVYDPDNMPVEYTAHFTFKNGDDKALTGVYNQTAMSSKFYAQLVADNWTEKYEGGSRIRLNFNEDYVMNSITANGEPLEFAEDDINVSYVINSNTEFVIDAAVRTYEDVTAQVYITNPEGVSFFDAYGEDANALTLTEGEAASGVKMGSITVPDGTKSYTLSNINPKTGKIFFSVKDGYYVNLVACANPEEEGGNNITPMYSWDAANGPFYMDVRKIEKSAKTVIAYVGDENVARIQGYSNQGDNISSDFLTPGYTEVEFDPAYNDHYSLRIAGGVANEDTQLFAYQDGAALTIEKDGEPQSFKLKDGAVLKVFLGTAAPDPNRVNFTVAEGLEATVMYDKIKQHTDLSQPLVSHGATLVEITPAQPCVVKVAGKEITADANGVYAFTTEKTTTKVELSPMPVKPLEVKSTTPAEGAEVKSFSTATIAFGMPNNGENFVNADAEKFSTITLTTPAGETIAAEGCEMNGEPNYYTGIPFGIFFPEQTAEGRYTLTIPAGVFFETAWSDADEDFVAKENGQVNDEIALHFTVNPNAVSAFDKYVLTPADGSAVRSISSIKVTFPDVDGLTPADVDPMPAITLTNGTTTYTGSATSDWSSWPMKSFIVSFMDANEEPVKVTEAGEWTLTVGAGLYTNEDMTEATCEVTGTITVDPNAPIWTGDPANGSKVDMPTENYTMITLNFDAETVSYTAKDELAGIRVMYRGAEVDRLEDISVEEANGYMLMDNYDEPQVTFAFNSSVFSAPGVLTIETDEGAFTVDGEASPAIEYSVTFGDVKEYTYNFTPASGSEVESLKEFTLEFPEATTASFDEENNYIILRSSGWIYPENPTITAVEGAEHPTFKLVFDLIGEDITLAAGSYSLLIGEGSFVLDDDQQSPEIAASWTLKRTTPVDLTWTADPAQDFVNEGYGMYPTFMFNEGEKLSKNYDSEAKIIVKFNDEVISEGYGNDSKMAYSTSIESMMPNAIMFNISGGILNDTETEGVLSITIEEGALLVSGVPCPKMEHTWNLVKQKEYDVKVTPAEGETVKELKEFTVEFIGAKTVEENFATGINVRSKDYKYNGVVESVEYDNSGENAKVHITLKDALNNNGEYMLQIYSSAFILDGCQFSSEIKVNYTVDVTTGINGIEADAKAGKMFDLSGRRVNKAGKGLYIVNGKKVLLNK